MQWFWQQKDEHIFHKQNQRDERRGCYDEA